MRVPEDTDNPGFDVLNGEIGTRTHYIHNAMAAADEPLTPSDIGERAERLAQLGGYAIKPTTFSSAVTGSHLRSMRDKPGRGYAEAVGHGRWQLTKRARRRIAIASRQLFYDWSLPEEVPHGAPLFEGATRTITVNAYERNPEARRRCIEHYGTNCYICKDSLRKTYGKVAADLIHVHHLRPLSEISRRYIVDPVEDLRPVCPNCHAVSHLENPPYSVEEVQAFLRRARGGNGV